MSESIEAKKRRSGVSNQSGRLAAPKEGTCHSRFCGHIIGRMDATLVAFLFVFGSVLFAILACARDSDGKRYGVKKMGLLWLAALPYFLSSAFEFTFKHTDGTSEQVKITYSTWFLLGLPIAMIADNILKKKKTNRPPHPTAPSGLGSS